MSWRLATTRSKPRTRTRFPFPSSRTGTITNRKFAVVAEAPAAIKSEPSERDESSGESGSSDGVEQYDIVIVGGGPVGLAFANALASSSKIRNSQRMLLVDGGDLSKVEAWNQSPEGTYSNRVSSITNASVEFLRETGGWEHVEAERTNGLSEMQVWDGVSDSRITFSASELLQPTPSHLPPFGNNTTNNVYEMARMTENLNLQRGLLRSLRQRGYVEIADKVRVDKIEKGSAEDGAWPVVYASNGRKLRARLLVGADGFNSPVRNYAGIGSYGWAYDTRAIVATLFHHRNPFGPNTTAFQRFLPTGPIAFLPLSPTASSMVWSTKPALANVLTNADPAVLAAMVNAAFRLPEISLRYLHRYLLRAVELRPGSEQEQNQSKLSAEQILEEIRWRERSHGIEPFSAFASAGAQASSGYVGIPPEGAENLPPLITSIQPGSIASFPLRFSHADSYIGEGDGARTVLIGDAAHTVHPLAGQGLNLGLADAQSLASCIEDAVMLGGDVGSRTMLQPYARDRYFENHKILGATDKLHKIYSTTFSPIVWARSTGLEIINELDTVKSAIMFSAGADSKRSSNQSQRTTAEFVAKSVEMISGGVDVASFIAKGLGNVVKSSVTGYLGSKR